MLSELTQIWIYAKSKYDEIENFITIPNGKFYIFPLIFDWNKLLFDKNKIKEGGFEDLKKMWFKPPKWRVRAILPNVYISLDKNWNIDWKSLKAFKESLEDFSKKFIQFKKVIELLNNFDFSEIKESLKQIPKKDENKKAILNILSLKVTNDFVKQNDFTVDEEKNDYFLAEIREIKNYFLAKNSGEWAVLEEGFCAICERFKNNIINFAKSKWINFPYKFYNTDKPWFFYAIDSSKAWKSFWVCQDCYSLIKTGYNFFSKKLFKNILGERGFVFPSIFFADEKKIIEIYQIFDEYSEENLRKIEDSIKSRWGKIENDFLQNFFDLSSDEEKQKIIETNFVRLNFLFWSIDASKSDELKIKFYLKDVLPSKVYSYYQSIKKLDCENLYKKYFQNTLSENLIKALPILNLFPTYRKWEYNWNVREFFVKFWEENYYQFLNTVLYWNKLNEDWIWSLVYRKLTQDFKTSYLQWKESKWWFIFKVWEVILILEYLKQTWYLDLNLKKMENLQFSSINEKIKNLENWFKQNEMFDSRDKIYVALIGLYVKLLLYLQNDEIKSMPFLSQIEFDNLTYNKLKKLLFKAREKFNKYSRWKFDYHSELFKTILETSFKIKNNLKFEEIPYYFSIGMEILPNIYRHSEEQKNE